MLIHAHESAYPPLADADSNALMQVIRGKSAEARQSIPALAKCRSVLDGACRGQKKAFAAALILEDVCATTHLSCCFWVSPFLAWQTRMNRASSNHSVLGQARQSSCSSLLFTNSMNY